MKEYLIDRVKFNIIYEKVLSGYVFHRELDKNTVVLKFISARAEKNTLALLKNLEIELN